MANVQICTKVFKEKKARKTSFLNRFLEKKKKKVGTKTKMSSYWHKSDNLGIQSIRKWSSVNSNIVVGSVNWQIHFRKQLRVIL